MNTSQNKCKLRELGLLPCRSDTLKDVLAKLREAFVSTNSSGLWQLAPDDSRIRLGLVKDKLLKRAGAPAPDVFDAMKTYVKQKRWKMMRSYIGLVRRIIYENNSSDPSRRNLVEFDA